ncbi:putative ribonuclease H-like domain-containing protein [Tanacetum coccineum]
MNEFCAKKGIKREYSIARTPQQNGVAERKNRTLIEAARTMLADSLLPIQFWAEAVNTACYVLNNVMVTKPKLKDPYDNFDGKISNISFMRPFGCLDFINTLDHLGENQKGKKVCWMFDLDLLTHQNYIPDRKELCDLKRTRNTLCDAEDLDDQLFNCYTTQPMLQREVTAAKERGISIAKEKNKLTVLYLKRSSLTTTSGFYHDVPSTPTLRIHKDSSLKSNYWQKYCWGYKQEGKASRTVLQITSSIDCLLYTSNIELTTRSANMLDCMFLISRGTKGQVSLALADESWVEAMQEELLQFKLQEVWVLCDLPEGKRVIGTKWVFRNKRDERGTIIKNKARLVAQGYRQEEGVDYDEWMSKVHSYMANIKKKCDVKQLRFEDLLIHTRGYRVVKALYGLHQAPRAWYERLSTFLLKHGYRRGAIDKTLFIKKDRRDIMLVQVYVDDIIFGSTKSSMVKDFEDLMQKEFKMSSMGELTFFLGSQEKMKKVKILIVHLYRSMIGCLMYLTASRPDIMFAVCLCARFQVTPKVSHLHAVKRIFRYLKHQPNLGLWYPKDSPFHLEAFSDSDYAGDNHDRRSTSGGCQYLGRRLVSWQCKKQTIVAISSTEAEYVAAASCCAQVLWMQNQLLDYGFNFMNTEIHIDNESTICIVKNPVFHSKTKHIQIRHHFIRDCYEQRLINVVKVHTDDNVADLLTKGFDLARFNFLVVTIGMMNL